MATIEVQKVSMPEVSGECRFDDPPCTRPPEVAVRVTVDGEPRWMGPLCLAHADAISARPELFSFTQSTYSPPSVGRVF